MWESSAGEFAAAVTMLLVGAAFGYTFATLAGLYRFQCRAVAFETGIQNTTLAIAILTVTFNDFSTSEMEEVLRFPLLFSFFLILEGVLLTIVFRYLSKWDPAEEIAEYEAKLAAFMKADQDEDGEEDGEGSGSPKVDGEIELSVDTAPSRTAHKRLGTDGAIPDTPGTQRSDEEDVSPTQVRFQRSSSGVAHSRSHPSEVV